MPGGPALIVGNGPGFVSEAKEAYRPGMVVFGVNRAVCDSPVPVDVAVSMHPDHLHDQLRRTTWPVRTYYTLPTFMPYKPWTDGNSGLIALGLALDLGHSPVHVAGIPLTDPSYERRVLINLLVDVSPRLEEHVIVPEHYWWAKYCAPASSPLRRI